MYFCLLGKKMTKVPIAIDQDVWREMRKFLAGWDDYSFAELVSDLWYYAMEDGDEFSDWVEEESEDTETESESESESESEEP